MRDEGSALPLVAALALLLLAFCGVVVDLSAALMLKQDQESSLATARDAVSAPGFAMMAKSSDDPLATYARGIVEALRRDGLDAAAEVWVYEVPASETPEGKRVIGWCASVSEDCETFFARAVGVESVPVASATASTAMPYSGSEAWRPSLSSPGSVFRYEAGSGAAAGSPVRSLSECPDPLKDAVERRLEAAREGKV